jgi:hypothetical protein
VIIEKCTKYLDGAVEHSKQIYKPRFLETDNLKSVINVAIFANVGLLHSVPFLAPFIHIG